MLFTTLDHGLAQYRHLRVWAERGLIRIEDSRDNSYQILSVREALARMNAMSEMVKNGLKHLRDNPGDNSYMAMDNIEDLQRFIDKMETLVQQAREQGSPDDASARRDLVRRRPVTVVVPGKNSVM